MSEQVSKTCGRDDCRNAAVFDSNRCLEHAEPITGERMAAMSGYDGAYAVGRLPADLPVSEPITIAARPYGEPVGFDAPRRKSWLERLRERFQR